MTNAPESPPTAAPQSGQVFETATHAPESSDSPTRVICDLADANAFVEEYRKPHVPVMSAFGAGRLHVCRLYGSWDLDRMASENASLSSRFVIRQMPVPSHHSSFTRSSRLDRNT